MAEETDPSSGARVRLRLARKSRRALLVGVVGAFALPPLMYLGYGRHNSGGMAALWWGVGFGVLILLATTWPAVRQVAWLRGRRLGGPAIGFDTVHLPDVTKASVQRHRKFGVEVLQLNVDSEVLELATYSPEERELYCYYDRGSLVAIADALALSSDDDAQHTAEWLRAFADDPALDRWPDLEPKISYWRWSDLRG